METVENSARKPGIVIFVAILNFITSVFFLFLSMLAASMFIFGNFVGILDAFSRRVTAYAASVNVPLGVSFLFGIGLVTALFFFLLFLLIGIGLLRGKKISWYFQVAMSIMGLITFPIGTVLNIIILIFFFQPVVRNHFKV